MKKKAKGSVTEFLECVAPICTPTLKIFRMAHAVTLPMPQYQSDGAAGFDLVSANNVDLSVYPGRHILVPTGLVMEIPPGYEVQVRPRSGLALRHGLTVLNSPGTIDWDFRGEVKVLLYNASKDLYVLERGTRVAQAVVAPVARASIMEVLEVTDVTATQRGGGGFGSTGVST